MSRKIKIVHAASVMLLTCGLICNVDALAQAQAPPRPLTSPKAITQPPLLAGGASIDLAVPLYQSRVVTVLTPANRVSVANPDVADIVVISPTELYVLGKDIGTTNVLLWDNNSHLIGAINVEVQHDLENLKRKFAELLPGQPIEVRSSQRSIVLSGRVSDAEAMNAATRIVRTVKCEGAGILYSFTFGSSATTLRSSDHGICSDHDVDRGTRSVCQLSRQELPLQHGARCRQNKGSRAYSRRTDHHHAEWAGSEFLIGG